MLASERLAMAIADSEGMLLRARQTLQLREATMILKQRKAKREVGFVCNCCNSHLNPI